MRSGKAALRILILGLIALAVTACSFNFSFRSPVTTTVSEQTANGDATTDPAAYTTDQSMGIRKITAEEAKALMESLEQYTIVDVREQYEYDAGHIKDAVLVPLGSIREKAPELLPDRSEVLLLYCRSGRRSAEAARMLLDMGYENIYDFGGIIDWPYEVEVAD